MIHQIVNMEVGGRGVGRDHRIAIEPQKSLDLRDHRRPLLLGHVEQAPHPAGHQRVRRGRVALRIAPVKRARRIMLGAHQMLDGLVDLARRIEEQVRDARERRLAPFVEAMQDERLERLRAGTVPVLRQSLALGIEQQSHDVLYVAHLVRRTQSDFGKRIETGEPRLGRGRLELHAELPQTLARAGSEPPVLVLGVVDQNRMWPGHQRRQHRARAFALTGRREDQYVAVPAMPQIPGAWPTAPNSQIHADPPWVWLENSEPLDESSRAARYEPAPLDEPSVTDVARGGPAR